MRSPNRYLLICTGFFMLAAVKIAHADTLMLEVLQKGSGIPVAEATVVVTSTNAYSETDSDGMVEFDDGLVEKRT